jgi:ZIP family zinc transporter
MTGLENAGVAFALVTAAGLSTTIGAAAVFFQRLVTLASKSVLAAGLGFSGGVMLYVSFVEIFVKSQDAFEQDGMDEKTAYFWATFCLFAGMLLLRLIALLVHMIDGDHHCACDNQECGIPQQPQIRSNVTGATDITIEMKEPGLNQADEQLASREAAPPPAPTSTFEHTAQKDTVGDGKLTRMGLNTAVAISIHNFPEGLATFVATLADPAIGATLAVAIAIHNIPEGLCVALPIYYATGSRMKGFLYAFLSGISEPIGALIGYIIIKSSGEDMNQLVYGILFGVVAGMMIMIVLLELIPTAYRYDPQDRVVTNSMVCGMAVMASSLCLFMA